MTLTDQERQAQGKFVMTVLNACRDIITEGEEYLNFLGKPYTKTPTKEEQPSEKEVKSLVNTQQQGEKGVYFLIKKSENINNPVFDKLQKYLQERKGFCQLYNRKFWLFSGFSNADDEKIGFK